MYRFLQIKILKNATLCLLYQAWGTTTMCRKWNRGDWTKRFEKHWNLGCFMAMTGGIQREELMCQGKPNVVLNP